MNKKKKIATWKKKVGTDHENGRVFQKVDSE